MAIWWLSKAIAYSYTLIAPVALLSSIIILYNHKKKEDASKADDDIVFEIKILNTSLFNKHNGKQVSAKHSASPNTFLTLKIGQVVSHLSKQIIFNVPLYSIKLMPLKVEKNCSISSNSDRSSTHEGSSVTISLNKSSSSCKNEFNSAQNNLNRSLVIHIGNLTDVTNNTIELRILNKSIKLSTLDVRTPSTSANNSINNRFANLFVINQKDATKEIDIIFNPFQNSRCVVGHKFHGNRLMSARNN